MSKFNYFPGFAALLKPANPSKLKLEDPDRVKTFMRRLEKLSRMIFLISYFRNNCRRVNKLDENYDDSLAAKFEAVRYADNNILWDMLDRFYGIVYIDVLAEFSKHAQDFVTSRDIPGAAGKSHGAILDEILEGSYISWTDIYQNSPKQITHSELNPKIIYLFLESLFGKEAITDDPCVEIYDFFNFAIRFPNESHRDEFVSSDYIDRGTAYSCVDGQMVKQYDF